MAHQAIKQFGAFKVDYYSQMWGISRLKGYRTTHKVVAIMKLMPKSRTTKQIVLGYRYPYIYGNELRHSGERAIMRNAVEAIIEHGFPRPRNGSARYLYGVAIATALERGIPVPDLDQRLSELHDQGLLHYLTPFKEPKPCKRR